MSQLDLFTGEPDKYAEKKYLTAGQSRRVIINSRDKLADIMRDKGQNPEILGVSDHYILVKPNELKDFAGENLVVAMATRNKNYKQDFIDKKIDLYSLRPHLHNQVYYDVVRSRFVVVHHKETGKTELHGARQSTLHYGTEFFGEAVRLLLSLREKGVDITEAMRSVNPGENNCITTKGVKLIDNLTIGDEILSLGTYVFPKQVSYDDVYLRKICSIPGIKVDTHNLPSTYQQIVQFLMHD